MSDKGAAADAATITPAYSVTTSRRAPEAVPTTASPLTGSSSEATRFPTGRRWSLAASSLLVVVLAASGCSLQLGDGAVVGETYVDGSSVGDGADSGAKDQDGDASTSVSAPLTIQTGSGPNRTGDGESGDGEIDGELDGGIEDDQAQQLCDFARFDAFQQMEAVADGQAPTSPECATTVERAEAAEQVFRASEQLASDFGVGEQMATMETCERESTAFEATNDFDKPVVFWGLLGVRPSDDQDEFTGPLKPLTMFVSDPIEPGGTYEFFAEEFNQVGTFYCLAQVRVLLAPIGEMAADAGLAPRSPEQRQASPDPKVWLPALIKASQQVAKRPDSFGPRIARVEDIHSPDLFTAREEELQASQETAGSTGTTVPGEAEASLEFVELCSVQDVTDGRDDVGQLVMLAYVMRSGRGEERIDVGLYRKGTDEVWRYAGRTLGYWLEVPGAGCNTVPAVELG